MLRTIMMLLGFIALPALAVPGSLIKDEDLRASPGAASGKLASLAKGSSVEVLSRQGGWTQVRSGKQTGWVRILSVRTSVSASGVGDLAAITAQRDRQVVAVAGLRGLNEEELKVAKYNANEMWLLDRYRATPASAAEFARAANLVIRRLDYLPAPRQESSSNTSNGSSGYSVWGEGL